MSDDDDDAPATKGFVREQIGNLEQKLEQRFEKIDKNFDNLIGAIMARFDTFRDEMRAEMHAEVSRNIQATEEATRAQIRAIDDKYTDLPRRVTRLEDAVFAPPPKKRRVQRR